jgi:uncharacterized protein
MKDGLMLEMRPGCERCDKDLPADQSGAFICSFECTFCDDCTQSRFQHTCPNCGGQLFERPTRTGAALAKFPASTQRIYKPGD